MKIFVKAKPGAKKDDIEKIDDNHFLVATRQLPEKGKANESILNILAEYFKIKKAQIKLVSGFKSKNKIFEIDF